jgi:BirA family biotin operon repressor/biotin-[acetyl-CoA-carboxylase] ligase
MTDTPLKNKVLASLEAARGGYVSGQSIANRLGVTRAAVWKAVTALRQDGHAISSSPNSGYMLAPQSDKLSVEAIRAALPPKYRTLPIIVFESTGSTNDEARRLLTAGEKTPFIVAANQQMLGRGRRGRRFDSPPDSGLYMSVALRPQAGLSASVALTSMAAVAAARAIDALSDKHAMIKWVNDIYIGGKKVCGILTEAVSELESGDAHSVVIGLGFNVHEPPANPALADIAGAIDPTRRIRRGELAARVAAELFPLCENIADKSYMTDYRARSLALGKQVAYTCGGETRTGTAIAVADDGALIVHHPDGSQTTLSTGEITLRLS